MSPEPTSPPTVPAKDARNHVSSPASGEEYRAALFFGQTWSGRALQKSVFEGCVFEHCVFDAGQWKLCRFQQCRFQDCRLLNVKLSSARFHEVVFSRCKLAGLNFGHLDRTLLFSMHLTDCKLLACAFPRTDLRRCRMEGCELEDCFFEEADLRGLDLSGTAFGGSRFHRCNLEGVNLIAASGFVLDPRENALRGARFSVDGALELLGCFGIVLE